MAYYDFLNVIFGPLLKLPPLLAVIIMSFIISLIIILITKYTTDQALMKRLKDEIKEHQKQIKELKSNPTEAMKVQKKAMEVNMKYMMHSLRPTIITFIPIILIFGWMSSTFAYQSIKPNQEFSVTTLFDQNAVGDVELSVPEQLSIIGNSSKKIVDGQATWTLKGLEGEHMLEFVFGNEKQQKTVLITNGNRYIEPAKKTAGAMKSIQINYKKLVIIPIGFKDWFGWLGTYILLSLIFTLTLRKFLKVY